MLSELEISAIADFLANSNDIMSWEEQVVYLASESEIKHVKAKKLVEFFQNQFVLPPL